VLATSVRGDVALYVSALAGVYSVLIIAYILSSMYFSVGGRLPYSRWSSAVLGFLREVCEPFLRIFRRVLPMMGAFDLSPILALITLAIVRSVLVSLING
jgi:YggT family protein